MNIQNCYTQLHGDYNDAKRHLLYDKFIEKYLRKFLDDKTMSQLLEAVANGDRDSAFAASHTLKGVAANMSFTELYNNVSALTEQLRPRDNDADTSMLEAVKSSYSLVISSITAAIQAD